MAMAQVLQPTSTHAFPASLKPSGLKRITATLASWLHSHAHSRQRHVLESDVNNSSTTSSLSSTDGRLDRTTHICKRCNRRFTLHTHRPSGLFYRDKCNYYHPGRLINTREMLDRYKENKAKQQELRARLGLDQDDESCNQAQFWSCCLQKDDGHPHAYGGCSFNGNKHVVDL